ncbi:PPC domain-containing DNA-binding protein [Spongorhabdus nitratireducens]
MHTFAFRLKPDVDLRTGIEQFAAEKQLQAGCILTCVGSLKQARLRLADATQYRTFEGPFEIVSLTGTLGPDGVHLHISVADSNGQVTGGHLTSGCPIYTTAEIVLGEISGQRFERHPDPDTGYKELEVISA